MTIQAIYENGVFKPIEEVSLPDGSKVEFEPRVIEEARTREESLQAYLKWLHGRTPEEIEETRRRAYALSPPTTPLPPGKTLSDMVEGKWPGGETDEQVHEALERTIHAIYEDGVFKPKEAVSLPDGAEVKFDPQLVETPAREETALEREIRWLTSRTPEEIEAARQRIRAKARLGRPLSAGKTLSDVVQGAWPGDETDEEIREILERLS